MRASIAGSLGRALAADGQITDGPAGGDSASEVATPSALAARAPHTTTETAAAQQDTTDRREFTILNIISIGGVGEVLKEAGLGRYFTSTAFQQFSRGRVDTIDQFGRHASCPFSTPIILRAEIHLKY
jgi:hypothetical protein